MLYLRKYNEIINIYILFLGDKLMATRRDARRLALINGHLVQTESKQRSKKAQTITSKGAGLSKLRPPGPKFTLFVSYQKKSVRCIRSQI